MPARSTIYLSEYIDKYAAASPATAATKKGLFKYFLSRNNHILKLLFNNFIVHVSRYIRLELPFTRILTPSIPSSPVSESTKEYKVTLLFALTISDANSELRLI